MPNDYPIKWSAYTALGFKPIKLDKPLVELSNDDLQHITDTATSASAFCKDESEVPTLLEYMQTTRDGLQWKGDVTSSPSSYENKKGKVISGFRVGFNKELSRSMGVLAFNERLAEMAR